MLFLNNDDVKQVLTMELTMNALDKAYRELARQEAVCRPRIDIQIPTSDPDKIYQWGTMEGGSMSGYFAIRMKSDVIYEQEYQGAITQEKYCVRPGNFCGLILLNSIENGEPLAMLNDGYLQHMRVGADSGIGAKYMARQDASVVGMIGSFDVMSEAGMGQPHAITGGVAEALIATATGLLIAILTLVSYNYFTAKVEREMDRMEHFSSSLELLLHEHAGKH